MCKTSLATVPQRDLFIQDSIHYRSSERDRYSCIQDSMDYCSRDGESNIQDSIVWPFHAMRCHGLVCSL